MTVIICAKYKKNPSTTVDATERTQFSKSRPNDLEDIGQGQGSSYVTHPLMLLIICTKYGKNPSWTVDATERTRDAGRTDGRTDEVKPIYPPTTSLCGGYNKIFRQRPAEIRKCEHRLSVAISNNNLLHHPVLCIIPPNFRPISEILRKLERQCHASDLIWNLQKFAQHGNFKNNLLHGTVHYPTKFQANSWNL